MRQNLVGCQVVKSADLTLPNPLHFPIYNDLPILEGAAALFARAVLKCARIRDRAVGNTRVHGSHRISLS